jgi:hypothetical protein
MSHRPVISKPDFVLFIADGKGRPLAQVVVGPDDRDPTGETITGWFDMAPGIGPDVSVPMVKALGKVFSTDDIKAENDGVPITLNGDPVQ